MHETNSHEPNDLARSAMIMRLDDFLKCRGLVATGGEAKLRIQGGEVQLNGEWETRRRKQLKVGDVIDFDGETLIVNETDFDR